MNILVQKFGGTSLATNESRHMAIQKIITAKGKYEHVIVVVSAMGRYGAPYATDTLLSLIDINSKKISNREIDLMMSCGEVISAVVMADLINKNNYKATAVTGGMAGIFTDNNYTDAEILNVDTKNIMELLNNNIIPVITGFQGRGSDNEVTTIGRGGSDTSAVLIGEAVGATRVEIYTDVNGIMTADPRICETAQTIHEVSYNEVFQMADSGAKVIHPRAVEIARRAGISLVIKNTFSDFKGTNITQYNKLTKKLANDEKLITSIAHRSHRMQFSVEGDINDEAFFDELAKKDVSIDIINIFPERRVFTVEENKKDIVLEVLESYSSSFSYIGNCCKITVIGERMTGVPGVMAKIIRSLSNEDIEILQTADSLSTIACLIKEEDLEKAVKALHNAFKLD